MDLRVYVEIYCLMKFTITYFHYFVYLFKSKTIADFDKIQVNKLFLHLQWSQFNYYIYLFLLAVSLETLKLSTRNRRKWKIIFIFFKYKYFIRINRKSLFVSFIHFPQKSYILKWNWKFYSDQFSIFNYPKAINFRRQDHNDILDLVVLVDNFLVGNSIVEQQRMYKLLPQWPQSLQWTSFWWTSFIKFFFE